MHKHWQGTAWRYEFDPFTGAYWRMVGLFLLALLEFFWGKWYELLFDWLKTEATLIYQVRGGQLARKTKWVQHITELLLERSWQELKWKVAYFNDEWDKQIYSAGKLSSCATTCRFTGATDLPTHIQYDSVRLGSELWFICVFDHHSEEIEPVEIYFLHIYSEHTLCFLFFIFFSHNWTI